MGAATTLVTVQEFLAMPEIEGERRELIGGQVVTIGYAKLRHELVKSNLIRILMAWLLQNPVGRLFVETTFVLDETNSFIPDLSIVLPERVDVNADWIDGAPEVAIEVVSSETATQLEKKIKLYLAHGAKSVWVVYPEHRLVRLFAGSGSAKGFEQDQTLEDPALPGFSTPVSAIFEGI
jgi:Uma2 family endonuclease